MTDTPELDDFKKELSKLKVHKLFKQLLQKQELHLGKLDLELKGLKIRRTAEVVERGDAIRATLRAQIVKSRPTVVALFLCPRAEAEKYRAGAEAFIDRLFFQEEIEECLAFLRQAAKQKR